MASERSPRRRPGSSRGRWTPRETSSRSPTHADLAAPQRARLGLLRARISYSFSRGSDAPPQLLDAARQLEPHDPDASRESYLEALGAAIFAGRLGSRVTLSEVAAAARGAPPGRQPPRPTDLLLDGLATQLTEGYVAGVAPLRRALAAFGRDAGADDDDFIHWFWLPWLTAVELWEEANWQELATRAVRLCRESGALFQLPLALGYLAVTHVFAGELAAAEALIAEGDAITEAVGSAPVAFPAGLLSGWRGLDEPEIWDWGFASVMARGEGRGLGGGGLFRAILLTGLGRYDEALVNARTACEFDDFGLIGFNLVELVEAAARTGARDEASAALRRLEERTSAAGTDWALGLAARSRALLSDGPPAEPLYREAIERLQRTRIAVHLARAHLLFGEWLRRENRRRDAREQLRTAHEMFTRFGAEAFSERARRELQATGETLRRVARRDVRRTDPPGVPGRTACARRFLEPGDRGCALHQPAHRGMAPEARVREARHQVAQPPGPAFPSAASPRPRAVRAVAQDRMEASCPSKCAIESTWR